MKVRELTAFLETIAPSQLQEDYDNSGLIIGDPDAEISGVLVCLDSIEAIVDEALATGCNVIVAHHPIIFRGLKRLNGKNYIERTVIKAIQNNICIYAIHTNLDNVLYQGVSTRIAETLGLINTKVLLPKANLSKLELSCKPEYKDSLIALIEKENNKGGDNFIVQHEQNAYGFVNIFCVCESSQGRKINKIVSDTNKTLSCNLIRLENDNVLHGSGIIGQLKEAINTNDFLKFLKDKMQTGTIRFTSILKDKIQNIAVCGGAGSFLLPQAISAGADIYISADFKYHEFFDSDNKIMIADIGHYESEQYTIQLLFEIIKNKFSNFAVHLTKVNTNPVNYL